MVWYRTFFGLEPSNAMRPLPYYLQAASLPYGTCPVLRTRDSGFLTQFFRRLDAGPRVGTEVGDYECLFPGCHRRATGVFRTTPQKHVKRSHKAELDQLLLGMQQFQPSNKQASVVWHGNMI